MCVDELGGRVAVSEGAVEATLTNEDEVAEQCSQLNKIWIRVHDEAATEDIAETRSRKKG